MNRQLAHRLVETDQGRGDFRAARWLPFLEHLTVFLGLQALSVFTHSAVTTSLCSMTFIPTSQMRRLRHREAHALHALACCCYSKVF